MKNLEHFLNEGKKQTTGLSNLSQKEIKRRKKKFKPFKKVKKLADAFNTKVLKKIKDHVLSFFKKMKLTEALEGEEKQAVLASYYGGEPDEYDVEDYIVVDDDEANDLTKEYIEDSIWAFNTWFIMDHLDQEEVNKYLGLEDTYYDEDAEEDIEIDDAEEVFYMNMGQTLEEYIKELQGRYEDGNDDIYRLLSDPQEFVDDAISADGRGHFLSSYDGEEGEEGDYFIYRIN